MSETLTTIDSLQDQEAIDFDDMVVNLFGEASQEAHEETMSKLEAYFGDRIFTYGSYSGTVRELSTCPAFMLQVSNGFEATRDWLLAHDGEGVEDEEDTPPTEETETGEMSESHEVPKEDKKAPPPVEESTPQLAAKEAPKEPIAANAETVSSPAEPAREAAVSQEVVAQESVVVGESDQSQSQHHDEVAQSSQLPSGETTVAVADDTPELIEETVDAAVLPEVQSPSVEQVQDIELNVPILVQEIAEHQFEDDVQTVQAIDEPVRIAAEREVEVTLVESIPVERVEDDSIPATDAGGMEVSNIESDAPDQSADGKETLESRRDMLLRETVRMVLDEPIAEEAEVTVLDQVLVSQTVESESESIVDDVVEELYEPQPIDETVIEFISDIVGELPNAELQDDIAPVLVLQQAAIVTYRIDRLSAATTASECHEELNFLKTELINLLRLVGYMNAEQIAEELIRRYDVTALRKFMQILIRTVIASQGVKVSSGHARLGQAMNYHYGSRAVRMSVSLAA